MFRRLQFRLHRFVSGEDLFDEWPGGDVPLPEGEARRPRAARAGRHLIAHR